MPPLVLTPHAKLSTAIVPRPPESTIQDVVDREHVHGAPARMSWARLLKRVFDIDIEHCSYCGGSLKIIAAIEDPPVIVRILRHLGRPTRAPAKRVVGEKGVLNPYPQNWFAVFRLDKKTNVIRSTSIAPSWRSLMKW